MKKYKALIFDLNGTMINDMEYHLDGWYKTLNSLGANLDRETMRGHMYGKSAELLIRIFGNERFTQQQMDELSLEKEKQYQKVFKPHLQLISGLANFLKNAKEKGLKMAIGSAAIPFNINFVIDGLSIRHYFDAIVSADDVKDGKPDPETFLKAAKLMETDPKDCLVFEDAPKGVEAAQNAGMDCVVLTTMHSKDEFINYNNIIQFTNDYKNLAVLS